MPKKLLAKLSKETASAPAANQVPFSVYHYNKKNLEYCEKNGIIVEAYSPLNHGHKIEHPTLEKISAKHSKTPAQVMLRWALQHNTVPLPKSVHSERIRENKEIFDFGLANKEMAELDELSR